MIQLEKYTFKTKNNDIKFYSNHLNETEIIRFEYCPNNLISTKVPIKPVPKPDFGKHKQNLQLFPRLFFSGLRENICVFIISLKEQE